MKKNVEQKTYSISGQLFEPGVHSRSNSYQFNKNVVSAQVTVTSAKFCVKYPTAACVGNTVVVSAGFEVYHAGDYFSVSGTIIASLADTDAAAGEAGSPGTRIEVITFDMKAADYDEFPKQVKELAGNVIDCRISKVESKTGANFSVRTEESNRVVCTGGFRPETKSKESLDAKVTAVVLREVDGKGYDCYQARCQTCSWHGGIHEDYNLANADAESHVKQKPGHIVNLYMAPCPSLSEA